MVPRPQVPGILQGDQQVCSTILMYTEKRGRGTVLVAIESTGVQAPADERVKVGNVAVAKENSKRAIHMFFYSKRSSCAYQPSKMHYVYKKNGELMR